MPEIRARAGVCWIRMATDLPAVLGELLHGRMSLREYLRSLRGPLEFAIFAIDDPMPALFDAPFMAWMAWKRRAKRPGSGADPAPAIAAEIGDGFRPTRKTTNNERQEVRP